MVIAQSVLAVLAHQGGWDEILFVIAPMAIFGGLLWLANDKQLGADAKNKATASKD